MIGIIWFFSKSLDLWLTRYGLTKGFIENNPIGIKLLNFSDYTIIFSFYLSGMVFLLVYEFVKKYALAKKILWYTVLSQFVVCFYNLFNLLIK